MLQNVAKLITDGQQKNGHCFGARAIIVIGFGSK